MPAASIVWPPLGIPLASTLFLLLTLTLSFLFGLCGLFFLSTVFAWSKPVFWAVPEREPAPFWPRPERRPVPEPVPTREGELVSRVATAGVPQGRLVSLMRWIDGRRLTTGFRPHHFRAWGRMVARLHQFSAGWQPPEGFERPVWDWEGQLGGRYFDGGVEELVLADHNPEVDDVETGFGEVGV